MTRSYYAKRERKFNEYIANHVAVSYTGEDPNLKKQAQANKNIILSKINANMLIKCEQAITADQVTELQKFKDDSYHFDSSKSGYSQLVEVNFADYDNSASAGKAGKLPEIQFTNAENGMLGRIEDINDQFNKETSKKSGRNAVNIAFFDVSQMSGLQQVTYLLLMIGAFAGLIYYFYLSSRGT